MPHRRRPGNDFSPWAPVSRTVADDLASELCGLNGVPLEDIAADAGCRLEDLRAFLAGRKPVSHATALRILKVIRGE